MAKPALRTVATGLQFPEGPVAMPDGSVILVEIRRQTLSRVAPDGSVRVIAEIPGGPNGAAVGPDGRMWVCNNGGFEWHVEPDGRCRPLRQADDYRGGSIDRVDLATGRVERVYTHARAADGEVALRGPNDLVFDAHGGFYFTDLGKARPRDMDRTGLYYGKADGSGVVEIAYPVLTPNGIGLSPDGRTLYAAETQSGRLWAWDIEAPGRLARRPWPSPHGGRMVGNTTGYRNFDSLAVDSAGNVCVATLMDGGISVIDPRTGKVEHVPMPDPYTTNICFGGPDLRTAYITQSLEGTLLAMEWPRPGLGLHWLDIDPKVPVQKAPAQ